MPKTLRLIELFAGYGSQAMAIKRLNIPFEHYKVVEFDKYAVRSYNAVHNTNFPVSDIRDVTGKDLEIVETEKYDYLLTYSFPCTDLSVAGKGLGMSKGSNTRSGLLWEVERILKECKELGALPQFLLMENVTQVHGENNIKDFGEWVTFLDSLGYISKWQDLNAKDYGIPQNRERVYTVSIRERERQFGWPEPMPLERRLGDMLEETVDEKYYLSDDRLKGILKWEERQKENGRGFRFDVKDGDGIARTMTTSSDRPADSTYVKQGLKVINATSQGYDIAEEGDSVNLSFPNSTTMRGRVGHGESQTITTDGNQGTVQQMRIRRLTPKECWRLMGFDDEDFEQAKQVNSDTQLYKQAGNSIVVNVLEGIVKNLFIERR